MTTRVWVCKCGRENPNAAAFCKRCGKWWQRVLVTHKDVPQEGGVGR